MAKKLWNVNDMFINKGAYLRFENVCYARASSPTISLD